MFNKSTIGIICLFGWSFFSALARVLTSSISQYIDPIVLCFYTFLLATLVFMFCNFKNIKNIFSKINEGKNRANAIYLNITTFGAWFFLIYPLKYIEPAIVSTVTLGLGPIATIILGSTIHKKESATTFDIFIAALLFSVILYTIFLCFSGKALLQNLNTNTLILVISSCFIVGFATAAGNIYIKKMSDGNLSPTEILSIRFILTIFLSGLLMIGKNGNLFISSQDFIDIIIIAICLIILPLYLVQISLKLLDAISVSIGASIMPILVIIFEVLENKISLSFSTVLPIIITTLLVLSGVYIRYKKAAALY